MAWLQTVKRGFEFTLMVVGESGLGKVDMIRGVITLNYIICKPATTHGQGEVIID